MSNNLVEKYTIQHKSLKLRIYPTKEQEILINKTFGCCRLIYNEYLQERNEFYIDNILPVKKTATKTEIANIYKNFKPKTEKEWKEVYPFMKEVTACSLGQARNDCDRAFINFLKVKMVQEKEKWDFQSLKVKKIIIKAIENKIVRIFFKFILKKDL